jgi:predicted methyltransferase
VPEEYVVAAARAAGFEAVERSEINANPRDTKDYPDGVAVLYGPNPPVTGESDRMTLKFHKP